MLGEAWAGFMFASRSSYLIECTPVRTIPPHRLLFSFLAANLKVSLRVFFLPFLKHAYVEDVAWTKRGEIVARVRLSGGRVPGGGRMSRVGRILSGPFRGAFRLKSDLGGSIINLG